jgi:hypothetical protein|nr:MAG TPA: hypothetical protein [Caudoviricetes sp.]
MVSENIFEWLPERMEALLEYVQDFIKFELRKERG